MGFSGNQAFSVASENPAATDRFIITSPNINVANATPGDYDALITIPTLPAGKKWTLALADYSSATSLAQHATVILTFKLINKGNSDADMLSTADVNTTKTTTGSAVTAYTKRSLTLNGTAANKVVESGDVLLVRLTSGGAGVVAHNLANYTLTFEAN